MRRSTTSRSRAGRPSSRAGVVAVVVGLLALLWAPSAGAAPALTIALDPPELVVMPWPVENLGQLTLAALDGDAYAPIEVQWSGTLTLQLPPTIEGDAMEVWLGLAPTDEDPPALEYATDVAPLLTVNDLGGGQYEVELPADDLVPGHGPFGYLSFDGLESTIGGVEVASADYLLHFDVGGAAATTVTPDLMVMTSVPCALSSPTPCPAYELLPGQQLALSVPVSSALRQLGLGTLDQMELYLTPLDEDGYPIGDDVPLTVGAEAIAEAVPGPDESSAPAVAAALADVADPAGPGVVDLAAAGVVSSSTPYTATITVPDSVPAGTYMLGLLEGGAGGVSVTTMSMEIQALPRANRGLRSDTGWVKPSAGTTPGAPLIAVGVGLVLIAGLSTVVVLRGRRPGVE